MTGNDFAMWLSGFLEASGEALTAEQVNAVKAKLNSVQPGYSGILPLPLPGQIGPCRTIPLTWNEKYVPVVQPYPTC